MSIPVDSVRVGAVEYAVEERPFAEMGDDGLEGKCSYWLGRISVADGSPAPIQAQTLVHEIVHALVHDSGYGFDSPESEERFVSAFSPRLTAFFADNPLAIYGLWRMLGVEP